MVEERIVESRKNKKRNKILRTIRYGEEISRHEVKKITSYSMTTVLNTINELIEKKLLVEEECTDLRAGRKPTWLHINPTGQYFIGVEFNADGIDCVVVNFAYEIVYSRQSHFFFGIDADSIIEIIKLTIHEAINSLEDEKSKILGIGIGVPGYIDRASGVGIYYPHIKNWNNINIKKVLEKEFKLNVFIENNINAITIAYRWKEYGETAHDFVLATIKYGTRIGSIIDNKLFVGNGGNAGEIGHMKLMNANRICSCGRRGCVDTEVSLMAIKSKVIERIMYGYFADIKEQMQGDFDKFNIEMVIKAAEEGSKEAVELLNETAMYLGQALAPVMATLNPKQIVIASTSGLGGEKFAKEVYRVISENVTKELLEDFEVCSVKMHRNMGAFGAAMLVAEAEYGSVETN